MEVDRSILSQIDHVSQYSSYMMASHSLRPKVL